MTLKKLMETVYDWCGSDVTSGCIGTAWIFGSTLHNDHHTKDDLDILLVACSSKAFESSIVPDPYSGISNHAKDFAKDLQSLLHVKVDVSYEWSDNDAPEACELKEKVQKHGILVYETQTPFDAIVEKAMISYSHLFAIENILENHVPVYE